MLLGYYYNGGLNYVRDSKGDEFIPTSVGLLPNRIWRVGSDALHTTDYRFFCDYCTINCIEMHLLIRYISYLFMENLQNRLSDKCEIYINLNESWTDDNINYIEYILKNAFKTNMNISVSVHAKKIYSYFIDRKEMFKVLIGYYNFYDCVKKYIKKEVIAIANKMVYDWKEGCFYYTSLNHYLLAEGGIEHYDHNCTLYEFFGNIQKRFSISYELNDIYFQNDFENKIGIKIQDLCKCNTNSRITIKHSGIERIKCQFNNFFKDSIGDRHFFMSDEIDLHKNRRDSVREKDYEFYQKKYSVFFQSESEWETFLNNSFEYYGIY